MGVCCNDCQDELTVICIDAHESKWSDAHFLLIVNLVSLAAKIMMVLACITILLVFEILVNVIFCGTPCIMNISIKCFAMIRRNSIHFMAAVCSGL